MDEISRPAGSGLSPEFRLAAATCIWPPGPERTGAVEAALAKPIDWDLLPRVARRHRMEGLAFHALNAAGGSVPAHALAALKVRAERQAAKGLLYAAETVRLCRLLREAGIPVACLKGAPLSMLAFHDIGLRHCRDIDLLVRPADALRADEVLAADGCVMQMPIGPHSQRQKKDWARRRKHFEYTSSKGVPVELHWRLFDNSRFFAPEAVPASWIEVPVLGAGSVHTLAARDLLLYLTLHGANHMWFRLKWLADAQALLRQSGPEAITHLRADAEAQGCGRAVAQTLALTQLLFGTPIGDGSDLEDAATSSLVQSALNAMTSGNAAEELENVAFGTSRAAAARFGLKRDLGFWLGEAASVLSDERDRKSAGLPHSLRFLLPVLRAPLWLGRRIRGRGQSLR